MDQFLFWGGNDQEQIYIVVVIAMCVRVVTFFYFHTKNIIFLSFFRSSSFCAFFVLFNVKINK